MISEGFWSEWGDSNARSLEPKSSAIPTSLHPDIHFPAMIPRRGVKIKFFLSVVIYVVKAAFVPLSEPEGNPLLPVLQGFAAFRLALFRIPPRHSQSRRATNCATPRYEVRRSGWAYSPKPGAIPASLYPDIRFSRQRRKTIPYPIMSGGKKQQAADRKSVRRLYVYAPSPAGPAVPTAALRPPGTDPRRWTAGTCRPSAAPDSGR